MRMIPSLLVLAVLPAPASAQGDKPRPHGEES